MDPFTIISARVLHAERVAEAAQRRSRWGASSPASDRQGGLWNGLSAWLTVLPFWHTRQHSNDKKVAA
jgi:hypothetical protein